MLKPEELLNKKLTDVAESNSGGDMWFIKAPSWEGWYLEDEENHENFSYWHLYDKDDHHKGTIEVEDGIITLLPKNLSENKITNEQLRMQFLSGIITESEYKAKLEEAEEAQAVAAAEKIEDKVETSPSIEAALNKLSEKEKQQLEAALAKLGITADSSVQSAAAKIAPKIEDIITEADEDLKKKVTKIAGLLGQGLVAQNAIPLLSLVIGHAINPAAAFITGVGLTFGVGGALIGLAKALGGEKVKESINENFVGMGMVGNIFDREKTDYELAFEHFTKGTSLSEKTKLEESLWDRIKNAPKAWLAKIKGDFPAIMVKALEDAGIKVGIPFYFYDRRYNDSNSTREGEWVLSKSTLKSVDYKTGNNNIEVEVSRDGGKTWKLDDVESLRIKLDLESDLSKLQTMDEEQLQAWYEKTVAATKKQFELKNVAYNPKDLKKPN